MKNTILFFLFTIAFTNLFSQGTLMVSTGTKLKAAGYVYLVADNANITNNGSLQMSKGDGFIKFTGSNNIALSGNGTTTIDRLVLAKQDASSLVLQSNISALTEINFIGGLLNAGNKIIDLGTTGVLNNEKENSRAFTTGNGYIQASRTLYKPVAVNVGNLGAVITSSKDMGLTTIRRGNEAQVFGSDNNSVQRYYDIIPVNNASLKATLRFSYFDAEINDLPDSGLYIWKSDNNTNWTLVGRTAIDTINNYVEKTNINTFSRWTLAQQVLTTYYRDADGDGYGNPKVSKQAYSTPSGYVINNGDCKDKNAGIHPGAVEICGNGIDDNCNGLIDEDCQKPLINIADASVYESDGQAIVTVSLSAATLQNIKVNYITANGTATRSGTKKDYTLTKGTLTIPAGSLSGTIKIAITKDNFTETTEYFTVNLSKPVNAVLGDSVGTVTIFDDANTVNNAQAEYVKTTALSDAEKGLSIKVYPNPSQTDFTFMINSSSTNKITVSVADAAGRKIEIKNNVLPNGNIKLGANYKSGIYIVNFMQDGITKSLKVIKLR